MGLKRIVSLLTLKDEDAKHVVVNGVKKIEIHFLPDVYIPCEVCHGTRYNSETLNIRYKGKNIADDFK